MKLVSLYSNLEKIFPDITFSDGFNVIFALVKDPIVENGDPHNLGKTFLIQVIDFCLLKAVKKDHPFREHEDLFGEFIFFLNLQTNSNQYVTVRRKVTGRKGISIHVSNESYKSLRDLPDDEWTYPGVGLEKGIQELDDLLDLNVIKPYNYRKGLGYFMRSQADYNNIFELTRFLQGKDIDWKPFLALMLGFPDDLLKLKYELDKNIDDNTNYQKQLEEEAGSKREKYDEIRGLIELREAVVERYRSELDGFSFREIEAEINEDIINRIEDSISSLNEELYKLGYEIREIDQSLESEYEFDITKIKQVFDEAQIYFPDSLIRDYDQLIEFNKRLTEDRKQRLQVLRIELSDRVREIENDLYGLNNERREKLEILKEKETIKKFRALQKRILEFEENLLELREQLSFLDRASNVQKVIDDDIRERSKLVDEIDETIRKGNQIYKSIRRTFSQYVEAVLGVQAILVVNLNQNGNLEFDVKIIDREISGRETDEGKGTSYRKLICACFDLTLLSVYSDKSFYRFVYHDGIFEGLDNRIKVRLLDLVRQVCEEQNIQYILTVIDTDLPRNKLDQKLLFSDGEVVRYLSDDGEQGRLFRMQAF